MLIAALLVAPAPTMADCTWYFHWYCSGCSKIGARTTGTEGPFNSKSSCESARSRMKSNYNRGDVDVEDCYQPGGSCDEPSASKPEPRRNQPRDNSEPGYTPPPPNPTPPSPGNVDPEAARKAAEAERARVAAEKERKEKEEFEKNKADALSNLKGTSSGDLGLKGMDSDTLKDNDSNPLGLKSTEEPAKVSGLSKVMPIYWRTVSVPAACLVADQLKAGDLCDVIDGSDLLAALSGPNAAHEFEKLVLKMALKKTIIASFGGAQKNLESKVDLVKAMYEAELKVEDQIYRTVAKEMAEDPAKRAWLTQQAKLDSGAVTRLKQKILSEKLANVQASLDYLQKNPNIQGIRFNCASACQQLTQAARGMEVLE